MTDKKNKEKQKLKRPVVKDNGVNTKLQFKLQ